MKTIKGTLALILSVILVFGTAFDGFAASDNSLLTDTDDKSETNRYYFYMPSIWKNKYSDTAGIYWWDDTDACGAWPGYKAHETEVKDVYYYDVPKDVTTIIWNNYLDGGTDINAEIYNYSEQTKKSVLNFISPVRFLLTLMGLNPLMV